MKPKLSIKLDYLDSRNNPSEVFEAMALYIDAYEDLGKLLTKSMGKTTSFGFQLNGVESGSIISLLKAAPGKVETYVEEAFYNSGIKLFQDLTDEETETEEQVEDIALGLEDALIDNMPDQIAPPHVDRQQLAFVLNEFSIANQKMQDGEEVILSSGEKKDHQCSINLGWRFTGEPKEMFLGKTEHYEAEDQLYVRISVNEGGSAWSFRSTTLKQVFGGHIIDKKWIEKYQTGLIAPIGPKDLVDAKISYDIYTPPKGKGVAKIRNVKILNISNILRHDEQKQHELKL